MLHNEQFDKVGHAKRLTTRIAGRQPTSGTYLGNLVIPLYESPTIRTEVKSEVFPTLAALMYDERKLKS